MNALAAAALAAGELICEFHDGYRRSLLAAVAGDKPATEVLLVYEGLGGDAPEVLSSRRPGRHPVVVRPGVEGLHFIEAVGPSVRVTTLTGCSRMQEKYGEERCIRFEARYAWHFDADARIDPDRAAARLPSGAASGVCEPWRVD
jgi:hypothetical protein